VSSQGKPNIVFVLCDNVGWGDFGVYGGGTPTPRIDRLAGEGIRFNDYTVEAQCTPTRSAIMTGRQSIRSGTFRIPFAGEGKAGWRRGSTRSPSCFGCGLSDGAVRQVALR
jgi:arylsulfatase